MRFGSSEIYRSTHHVIALLYELRLGKNACTGSIPGKILTFCTGFRGMKPSTAVFTADVHAKNPACCGVFCDSQLQGLQLYNIRCSRTFRAVNNIKFYPGTLGKGFESL